MKKVAAKGKKNAGTHKLSPPMPDGTIVTDLMKNQWKIGPSIGSGGFGLIYLTQPASSSVAVSKNAEQVMKLEPFNNGPLFCELAFFQRAGKPERVKEFMSQKGSKSLGMPAFHASGNHEKDGQKYRFMVIQRFQTDLQKIFESNGNKFNPGAVFNVALQVLDVLEFIHKEGYAHADIKAANLMTGFKNPNQIYLIDYGLAYRFLVDGKHKEYKEDPRRAHDGTTEYASRDAHKGVWPSARGDLEILGYCMWQWLAGQLPWENDLADKNRVSSLKIKFMNDVDGLVASLIKDHISSKGLCTYLTKVSKLEYDEGPDYDAIKQLLKSTLTSLKCKPTDKLDFGPKTVESNFLSPMRKSIAKRRGSKVEIEVGEASRKVKKVESLLKSPLRKSPVQKPKVASNRTKGRLLSPSPSASKRAKPATVQNQNEKNKGKGETKSGLLADVDLNRVTRSVASTTQKPDLDSSHRKRRRVDYREPSDDENLETPPKKQKSTNRPARTAPSRLPEATNPGPSTSAPTNPSKISPRTKHTRRNCPKTSSYAQTSPGLKGLPRSW